MTFLHDILLYGLYSLTLSEAGISTQRKLDLFGLPLISSTEMVIAHLVSALG